MKNKKDIIINASLIGFIVIGYVAITFVTSEPQGKTLSFESPGLQSPLVPLSRDSTQAITLKELRGQPLLINFWASWCEACESEKEELQKLEHNLKGIDVKMIGIASSDNREALEKSGKLKERPFKQFLDKSGDLALALDVKTLPQTLLIDRQGRVISHIKNTIDSNQVAFLEKEVTRLSGTVGVLGEVPSFSLESSTGIKVSNKALEKKVWVADFIFTSCPGRCPLLTSKMHELQEKFKKDDGFHLVSISVDPNTDTPEVLRNYQEKHGADPSRWYFLTGKFGAIKTLLSAGFKLGTPENPELHTSKFVLVDGLHRIRGYYDSESSESFGKLKSDITHLLKEAP